MITSVMGILNVTPDSFSDGGKYNTIDKALYHAEEMLRDGAGIIDIGGESTRPGAPVVSAQEETERVTPVIESIKSRLDIKISLDTYKAETAAAGIAAGAEIINDIGGLLLDSEMGEVVSRTGVIYILTHNTTKELLNDCLHNFESLSDAKISLHNMNHEINSKRYQKLKGLKDNKSDNVKKNGTFELCKSNNDCIILNSENEDNYVNQFCAEAQILTENALSYGIAREKIIFDPGIGFHKTQEQNLILLKHIGELCKLNFAAQNEADKPLPLLLGVSRKSVIGEVLGLPIEERLEGTLALTAHAVLNGVRYVRVHDVKENVRVIRMLEPLLSTVQSDS